MKKQSDIIVAGERLGIRKMLRPELKGIYVDALVGFDFYMASFHEHNFVLLYPKDIDRYTPVQYSNISKRIGNILNMPVVFLFKDLVSYQRNRMIGKGAYFIVSDKYAYLPFLIINAHSTEIKKTGFVSSVAQYLILYHLQSSPLEGKTFNDLESLVPYKYVTLTRAVKQLGQLGLCETQRLGDGPISLHFHLENKDLWSKALPYMRNPIKTTMYCDAMGENHKLAICSYNALSRYSSLNPDNREMYAIDNARFKKLDAGKVFIELNSIDGNIKVEIWEYSPLGTGDVVDKLSLYLSLKEDKDPRVENELETMINNLW